MITKKEIKKMLESQGKKISKEAIEELKKITRKQINETLENAIANSEFKGRKIIKKQDLIE